MHALASIRHIFLSTPDGRPLAHDLSLTLGRERVGLVGRNGSGKSTLIGVIAGEREPAAGTVARFGRISVLRQDWPDGSVTLAEALGVAARLARLAEVQRAGWGAETLADEEWGLEERIGATMSRLGLGGLSLGLPLASLSGGERTRLSIARLLLESPDLLLLDEPTNNLDRSGRQVIADLVAGWRGGVLVAGHDRELLEGMDRIVELSAVGATSFGGGWSAFAEARAARRRGAEAELAQAKAALSRSERDVQARRERKAQRAKPGLRARAERSNSKLLLDAAKERSERTASRDRLLGERIVEERAGELEAARRAVEVLTPLEMRLPPSGLAASRELLAFEEVTLMRGGRTLFEPLSLVVRGPTRLALRGPNGSGKSSLLALAMGALRPTAGHVRRFEGAIALLDQWVRILDPGETVLANIRRLAPALDENGARAGLARFAFRGEAALQRVENLSGGERLRAGLACVFSSGTIQLLLLDEPTNHLDIESIEVLEAALRAYDGAFIVASHDETFLDSLGLSGEIRLGTGKGAG
ncbi:ATP-binding cassette domain-containing protein [Afifella sp. IM 167]|uniref:ATP-binding cassette domain-containing protein n=1 Tax=Afifella sp. IM 167 TaxID=2033586 RepID=UPI001CCA0D92|nr:ATP-binding cassette domain-containing protein [Afifella sp. IM 167]MBZ8134615.1 ABC transporter [Afifella sp. IM 167]